MLKINGNNVELTYGDSATLSVIPYEDEEHTTVYSLGENEKAVFSVYPYVGADSIITKETTAQDEEGALVFDLLPEETEINRGEYVFDVKLVGDSGVETFIGGERFGLTLTIV